jgi:hypothetical protein
MVGGVLPLAHAGHYAVWFLYAIPVLVVLGAIVRSVVLERRAKRSGDGLEDLGETPLERR